MISASLAILLISGQFSSEPLDPKAYVSPSGKARLWVNPSSASGRGNARYRMARGGRVAWEKSLSYSMRQAAVSDDGSVAGFGYRSDGTKGGALILAFIAPDGKERKVETVPRRFGKTLHAPPQPECAGVLLDQDQDRVIFRIKDDTEDTKEHWWLYRLSSGERLRDVVPAMEPTGQFDPWIVNAAVVPGTPLVLVNWWLFDDSGMGGAFSLVDGEGQTVWKLPLPGDYEGQKDASAKDRLRLEMQTKGAILGAADRSFALKQFRRKQVVRYSITGEKSGWQVAEAAAAPLPSPTSGTKRSPGQIPILSIPAPSKTVLPVVPETNTAIRQVEDFLFSPKGEFVIVRRDVKPTVVVTGPDGRLVREIVLPNRRVLTVPEDFLAHVGGSRYVFIRCDMGRNRSGEAWSVDISTGAYRALPAFKSDAVKAVAGYQDGTFAVLSAEDRTGNPHECLDYFAADGRRLWRISQDGYSGAESELLSPEDVAFDPQGHLLVLDVVRHVVQRFGRNGKYLSSLELKKAWKRDPQYPSHIVRDRPDGFIVEDSGRLYRLGPDGTIRRSFLPRESGKTVTPSADAHVDAKGQVWITNRDAIFQLDEHGRVAGTLGRFTQSGGLRSVVAMAFQPSGRMFALDGPSGQVFAFDAQGRPSGVFRPQKGDLNRRPVENAWMQVATSGALYVDYDRNGNDLIRFSPEAGRERIGRLGELKRQALPPTLPPTWCWWRRSLLNERGEPVLRIERWPNQQWLQDDTVPAVSPDGRLAVFEGTATRSKNAGRLAFYSPSGKPLHQITLPPDVWGAALAGFSGKHVFLQRQKDVVVVDTDGKVRGRIPISAKEWSIAAAPGGFFAYDGKGTVLRYRIPD